MFERADIGCGGLSMPLVAMARRPRSILANDRPQIDRIPYFASKRPRIDLMRSSPMVYGGLFAIIDRLQSNMGGLLPLDDYPPLPHRTSAHIESLAVFSPCN